MRFTILLPRDEDTSPGDVTLEVAIAPVILSNIDAKRLKMPGSELRWFARVDRRVRTPDLIFGWLAG